MRTLICAPQRIQWFAQRLFRAALILAAVLLRGRVSLLGVLGEKDLARVSSSFFIDAAGSLLKPPESGAQASLRPGMAGSIGLVLVAIVAPVLIRAIGAGLPRPSVVALSAKRVLLHLCTRAAVPLFGSRAAPDGGAAKPDPGRAGAQDAARLDRTDF